MGYFNLLIGIFATVILFLHALQGFSREVQEVGGDRLKSALQRLTSNRFAGFTLGAVFTALVQSSSAVTALAVALVDAGANPPAAAAAAAAALAVPSRSRPRARRGSSGARALPSSSF